MNNSMRFLVVLFAGLLASTASADLLEVFVTYTLEVDESEGEGSFDFFVELSGDPGFLGLANFAAPLTANLTSLENIIPQALVSFSPQGNIGFTALRSEDLLSGGAFIDPIVSGAQPIKGLTGDGFFENVFGFGQIAGNLDDISSSIFSVQPSYSAKLLIAQGTYDLQTGLAPTFDLDRNSILTAGVFTPDAVAGESVMSTVSAHFESMDDSGRIVTLRLIRARYL